MEDQLRNMLQAPAESLKTLPPEFVAEVEDQGWAVMRSRPCRRAIQTTTTRVAGYATAVLAAEPNRDERLQFFNS